MHLSRLGVPTPFSNLPLGQRKEEMSDEQIVSSLSELVTWRTAEAAVRQAFLRSMTRVYTDTRELHHEWWGFSSGWDLRGLQ